MALGRQTHGAVGKRATDWVRKRKNGPDGGGLVIAVKNLTGISQEGEDVLLALMNEGAKFHCRGVFAKQILRQLASVRHRNVKEATR